tara:strand:- start:8122 stop:9603 length:1482 start_codon:yes stop_codon:yes gene_type:complete
MSKSAISPTRQEDYAQWYQAVIKAADLAEHAPVRGCMIMKPWGYAIWEQMQKQLDERFKKQGHQNIYLPMFIPLSYFQKEADHVSGFAKECAVVTHHQLKNDPEKGLVPSGELDEPLVVRPTSEPLFGEVFKSWIHSYRDLPMCLNQWANVVRWEMRTRLFLRTSEFLWQEGHTAHATSEEAQEMVQKMLSTYQWFAEEVLSIPVFAGEKTEYERFGGAKNTYTIEAMMQDGKALQAATSHYFGQNFSQAFDVTFQSENNELTHVYNTSWGITTRMIGALIMAHGDDDGLRLTPEIAPYQVVILPIHHKEKDPSLEKYIGQIETLVSKLAFNERPIRVFVDNRDLKGGEKAWSWYKKGVPIRIEVGMREFADEKLSLSLRTNTYRDRVTLSIEDLSKIPSLLEEVQTKLYDQAKAFQSQSVVQLGSQKEIEAYFSQSGFKGFVKGYFGASSAQEADWCKANGISVRCILPNEKKGPCILTGKEAPLVIFARAY